jgi:hypothetical protein
MLRLFKSTCCYAQSVARFLLGKNQIAAADLLSGSVNVYYALFDIGIAGLDLVPEYRFILHKEFAFPRGENWNHIRRARLTCLTHQDTIAELRNVIRLREQSTIPLYPETGIQMTDLGYRFLVDIVENLERWRELRELFSYGPWIRITSINQPTNDNPISRFVSNPAFFESEAKADENEEPHPFFPLQEELKILVPTVGSLIDRYSSFLAGFVGDGKMYDWYTAATHMTDALIQSPAYFWPYIPESISKEAMQKLTELPDALGERFRPITELLGKQFLDVNYLGQLRTGSKIKSAVTLMRGQA